MKTFLLSACLIILGFTISHAQEIPCNDIAKLTAQLKSIKDSDQNVRASLMKMMSQPIDPAQLKLLNTRMQGIDKADQLYVGKMLDQCGWPKGLKASENDAIYLVILHADTTFMEKHFSAVKEQEDKGIVKKSDMATLQDKLLMRKGLKQLYGTQSFTPLNGAKVLTLWPVDDPDQLAARRSEVGLLALDDYAALIKKAFGQDVVWDKNLTLEDARNAMKKKQ